MISNTDLFERAQQFIPGGVNSPVRAFLSVGGCPRFIKKAYGPYIWDAEGKQYIDYVGSWGPAILGHSNPEVINSVIEAVKNGLSFGAPTEGETELAKLIISRIPSIEQIRLVSSGTEATMTAIRLARGFTNKTKIIKFEGCYHGHSDSLLVKAGSGLLTLGQPTSSGVPTSFIKDTIVLEFNNIESVEKAFEQHGKNIACIIVEPIAGNMNLVKPKEGFLKFLRNICTQNNSLLIFDEVMTGFRVGLRSAQGLFGISPDITTLAKIIGGGLPVGAIGARKNIMEHLAPQGGVYQAGTLSGNPIAVAAGIATLKQLGKPDFYENLAKNTNLLTSELQRVGRKAGFQFSSDFVGGMFGIYFNNMVPTSFIEASSCNSELFKCFFHEMLDQGVYLAPSSFEAGFLSSTHDENVIQKTIDIAEKVFRKLEKQT
ncbi:glutamate-1-semialdehyde 2,1-aminomutase hemL [Candidatus Kinetoplastibacterium blastocrithidii TCC012E]|uniref:Glutamate-1-semialdehyde 2,1-aminomutase n=2 Tax=Candidatus Kinetoplastidibacterium blastocrithidiae TaxID=233181 RepID=M1M191_9PROT|nr:glutamate-1-semialdehyde 2,1-aminomutase [Candidatus Kinetoplastibacterium blastocrithidii]AEM25279.1 glutamate-1-semialdehyde 2,1-aminomutase [Candidatus Kinetoplastibacterium blastocrithidii]AFZ83232.1 glutamate-1-semialdehyde-2,1-aminomutase [Candidatus Kinetoplastibacterium blastocrithidii (ex Strigomonas culicis)]AGF50046.1 glutamate-1-semialdehyde 2,1-aminomutase hemL [Candidatus Kinetoplastibacterium blastocrithidii TCC012E]